MVSSSLPWNGFCATILATVGMLACVEGLMTWKCAYSPALSPSEAKGTSVESFMSLSQEALVAGLACASSMASRSRHSKTSIIRPARERRK